MSDDAPLYCRKVLGGLRASNRACEEAFAALGDGQVRIRITSTRGNQRRNGLYWVVLGIAAPMLSDRIEGPPLTVNMLHRVLKDKAGKFRLITLPSGDTIKDYDSISFAKMPENERAEFITWSIACLAKWLGVTESELRTEGELAA